MASAGEPQSELRSLLELPNVEPTPISARVRSVATQWAVPRALRASQADVFHATYWYTAYRPGVPTVLSLYDIIGLLPVGGLSPMKRAVLTACTRLALAASAQIITLSDHARDDIHRLTGVPINRISVTPLAVTDHFRPRPRSEVRAMAARMGLPDRYILYVGSNKPHKNLELLLRAWPQVLQSLNGDQPPLGLALAGPWDRRWDAVRQRAEASGLAGIHFLGRVGEDDLPVLYSGADAFVFPSLYEGFGLPPLEAMACGTPVISSNRASLPEVVGNGGLLLDPTTPGEWAEAIVQVLSQPDLAAGLRGNALAQAARFSWRRTAEATLAAYERAAGSVTTRETTP